MSSRSIHRGELRLKVPIRESYMSVYLFCVAHSQSKDPFDKPSPGLVKRLAAEARNEGSRRVFQDEAGPSDEQRRIIMLAKAEKYAAMKRGDFSGLTARELEEGVLDVRQPPAAANGSMIDGKTAMMRTSPQTCPRFWT